jgi:dolichyl-diphosphooligosaccharide---protein glycosyltransferase
MAKKKKAPTEEKPSSVPASQAKDAAEAAPPAGAPPSPPRTVDITKMKENKNSYATAGNYLLVLLFISTVGFAGYHAYDIRLYAIRTYGLVIHEFDPWFNYRATEYLRDHGIYEFFHWFDYKVWYPLGRPVGTTIYPGMQLTSVGIWRVLNEIVGHEISLNDVCCYVPTWGGVAATTFLALLTRECSGSWTSGAIAATIMAIVPAHIMRSVGGGYDNESIALTAMCMTFFLWVRSLRTDPSVKDGERTKDSIIYGVLSGLAYIYMAAAWGGFIFVINLIAFHAAALVIIGRYSSKLHTAYSLFYLVGTIGAMQIPVIGMRPLQSLEQLSGLAVFIAFQILEFVERKRRSQKLSLPLVFVERVKATLPALLILGIVTSYLYSIGHFGPLGARIRGLFVKHTRTGNPLVDSVAEHQPASSAAYKQYLHHIYNIVPYGFVLTLVKVPISSDANFFLVAYAVVAYYFANKMARLIILLGPISSALGGIALGFALDQLIVYSVSSMLAPALGVNEQLLDEEDLKEKKKENDTNEMIGDGSWADGCNYYISNNFVVKSLSSVYRNPVTCLLRVAAGVYLINLLYPKGVEFFQYSHQMAEGMSGPSIMFKAKLRNGQEIIVDDYREAYWWLRDKTPEDSRVMAWWDYGYQITGIGNRTTIADGNTWNHEHIATLGRILSAPEKRAHKIARHLADYVLVWAGGGGDDLAKSPHMARIGNSVYHDICAEPTCSEFGFYRGGMPTPMMRKSLLYKLTQFGYKKDVHVDPQRFEHVFTSKYGKVRIFKIKNVSKKSKRWIANPENRVCDAPGSWYCTGQYPPALKSLIAKRKNFRQLEDFNVGQDAKSKKYQEEYHKQMSGGHPQQKAAKKLPSKAKKKKIKKGQFPQHGTDLNLKYVGCTGSEGKLGNDKEYVGGNSGANIELLQSIAWEKGKKYIALARVGSDGHSFVFNKKMKKPTEDDKGKFFF